MDDLAVVDSFDGEVVIDEMTVTIEAGKITEVVEGNEEMSEDEKEEMSRI
jgi:ABC-type enterochelin transport system ATPase subunit